MSVIATTPTTFYATYTVVTLSPRDFHLIPPGVNVLPFDSIDSQTQSSLPTAESVLTPDLTPDLTQGLEPVAEAGYRGSTACSAAGITYRQLDYWARTGLIEPSVRPASGSGSARLYGFRDILVLKIVKRLLDTGVSLQNIRTAVEHLRLRGVADLAKITLMSDGATIYECTSNDEVIDILAGGQGVFGIALGRVWAEVEGTLADLPRENPILESDLITSNDELSLRRRAKGA